MAPVAKAHRRYFIELMSALILYMGAVMLRASLVPGLSDPIAKDVLIALPVVPVLLMATAIVRYFHRVDEYKRRQILEALATAAAMTCIFSVCWMFLEDLGLPQLSLFWAWPIMAVFWTLSLAYLKWHDLASEGKGSRAIRIALINLGGIAGLTLLYAAAATHFGWPLNGLVLLAVATALLVLRVGFAVFTKKEPC